MDIASIVSQLQDEKRKIDAAIVALTGIATTRHQPTRKKRSKMSAAGRARIAAAQRARWAKVRRAGLRRVK